MKKLSGKLKNTPTDTQLVCSSVNPSLNRVQRLSVTDKVLTDNNSEVDQSQHTGRLKVIVYVISKEGHPLMPCTPAKAKKLLTEGKAHVIKRSPFTIQLNFVCENQVQDVTLGIDSGYNHIGFSATTEKREIISGEVVLDDRTNKRLTERSMYRRGRRNRLWYREPRFSNRTRKTGWLPPSVQRRYDTHINLITKIKKILPVTKVIIEIGNFDIQKIENPEISGKEYQKGPTAEYINMKSYLMAREQRKCQICGKEKGTDSFAIHHIIQRKDGGTDKQSNLALVHKKCHEKFHKSGFKMKVAKNKIYKEATFMNIIKNKFQKDIECQLTFGYLTYSKRYELELEKSHINDAFVISCGEKQIRCNPFSIIQRHRNNRVLQCNRKGFSPSIRKQRYKIQVGDIFWVNEKRYNSNGIFNNGKYLCFGSTKKKEYFRIDKVEKYFNQGNLIWSIGNSSLT